MYGLFGGKKGSDRVSQCLSHPYCIFAILLICGAVNLSGQAPAGLSRLSSGCGKSTQATGVFTLETKDGRNVNRSYLVQVPKDYRPSQPYALVFVFHAVWGTSANSFEWGLQNAPGAAESAVFVFPQGVKFQDMAIAWDDTKNGYDMPFFDNMVTAIEGGYCIDKDRIFATGFSWGADFVTALTCYRADVLRAVEVNSASDEFGNKEDPLSYPGLPCTAHKRPAIRFEHAPRGDAGYPPPLFVTTSGFFRHLNGCNSTLQRTTASINPTTFCVAYQGCQSPVIDCGFETRFDHSLPPTWAQDTWAFFSSFR